MQLAFASAWAWPWPWLLTAIVAVQAAGKLFATTQQQQQQLKGLNNNVLYSSQPQPYFQAFIVRVNGGEGGGGGGGGGMTYDWIDEVVQNVDKWQPQQQQQQQQRQQTQSLATASKASHSNANKLQPQVLAATSKSGLSTAVAAAQQQQQQQLNSGNIAATKFYLPHGFYNPFGQLAALFGGGDGDVDAGGEHLGDYNLLFNAARHTVFQLHTNVKSTGKNSSNNTNNYTNNMAQRKRATQTRAQKTQSEKRTQTAAAAGVGVAARRRRTGSTMRRGRAEERVLHYVSNSIGAAFGVQQQQQQPDKDAATAGSCGDGVCVQEVQLYNAASLRQSRFNPFNPTRILIHGWFGGANAGVYQQLIPEYLRLGAGNYNVFTVDWGRGAFADYLTASYRVKPVGKVVARFIDFLHAEAGMHFEDVQLVGFSMGAHIAGIAGKHVQTGRLPCIYALDPALPFFRYDAIEERIALTDAAYVEVIHTSVGTYGYDRPLGHVDFYMNWGSQQPGCFLNECSHMRAYQLYAESLRTPAGFRGVGCDVQLWGDLVRNRRCMMATGLSMAMGGDKRHIRALQGHGGVYHVPTYAQAPFAMG